MASDFQRIRMELSYDGTDFFGWQKQPLQEPTLQGLLEELLSQIFDSQIRVIGSGRTDRGVHALSQWAHADIPANKDLANLTYRLQRMTPETINIKRVETAPDDFHAQISALSKRYVYRIFQGPSQNPFLVRYCWPRPQPHNLDFLQKASEFLLGEHDFSSFQTSGTEVRSTVRNISTCRWRPRKSGFLDFHIEGSGFLKQMVRNIVGTLIEAHDNNDSPGSIWEVLGARNRQSAGSSAPPQGLFLASVKYPPELDNKCRKL